MRLFAAAVVLSVYTLALMHSSHAAPALSCSATIAGSETVLVGALKQIRFHVVVPGCSDSAGSFEYLLETERTDTHEKTTTLRNAAWGPVHEQSDFTFSDSGGGGLDANFEVLSVLVHLPVSCICP